MRVATWNVQWAAPKSARGVRISAKLHALDADVMVVTEGLLGLLPEHGYLIDAGSDWGYAEKHDRRKVLAWSKRPWQELHLVETGAAKGRVLAATTATDDGPVRVIAVCIPWQDAHVSTGRKDRKGWEEHVECCGQLLAFRQAFDAGVPTLVAGDYNQRIPRKRQPIRAEEALDAALVDMTVWTGGDTHCGQLIDHIAGSPDLAFDSIEVWPAGDADGPLSDHSGVAGNVHIV